MTDFRTPASPRPSDFLAAPLSWGLAAHGKLILVGICSAGLLLSWQPSDIPWRLFQICVFALTAVWLVKSLRAGNVLIDVKPATPLLVPIFLGVFQILFGLSVDTAATGLDVLRWGTYFCVFFLSLQWFVSDGDIRRFRIGLVWFALALSLVSSIQAFGGDNRIFWLFPNPVSNGTVAWGPFLNHDHYCTFMLLAVPVAIWGAVESTERTRLIYSLAAGFMSGTIVGSASRAGSALLALEWIVLAIVARRQAGVSGRRVRIIFGQMLFLVIVFSAVCGWETLYAHFKEDRLYAVRYEILQSSWAMFQAHPVAGSGLGTWPEVYPRFAVKDFSVYVNAAHNDWVQWLDEGGPILPLAMAVWAWSAFRAARRSPWALGIPLVFVHCIVDFPMQGRFFPAILALFHGVALQPLASAIVKNENN